MALKSMKLPSLWFVTQLQTLPAYQPSPILSTLFKCGVAEAIDNVFSWCYFPY